MKKLLSIAVCASAVAAFAETTEVSVGEVGVTKITSSLTNTVVAVSYGDLASDSGITLSNIVKTTGLDAGDRLHVFTGSSDYQTYVLTPAPGDGHLYWNKTTTWGISADGEFYDKEAEPASDVTLAAGVGFWLVRNTDAGQSFSFYTYGRPVTASATATAGKVTLVGNPNDVPARPNPSVLTDGDRVIVPNDSVAGGAVTYTYLSSKAAQGGWWHWEGTGSSRARVVSTLPEIPAGTGCWYAPKAGAAPTIGWTPAN